MEKKDTLTVKVGHWYRNKAGDEVFIICENPLDVHKFIGLNRRFGHVALWYHDGRGAMGMPAFSPVDLVQEIQGKTLADEAAAEVSAPTRSRIDTILFDFENCTLNPEMRKERVAELRLFMEKASRPPEISLDGSQWTEEEIAMITDAKPGEVIRVNDPAADAAYSGPPDIELPPASNGEQKSDTAYDKPTEGLESWGTTKPVKSESE